MYSVTPNRPKTGKLLYAIKTGGRLVVLVRVNIDFLNFVWFRLVLSFRRYTKEPIIVLSGAAYKSDRFSARGRRDAIDDAPRSSSP